MTELCQLAEKWGTDKAPRINGKLAHGYTPYYHQLFGDRILTIRKVLEIGIDVGRSLFMWQEYFPVADIYGVDADPGRLITGGRIQSFLCDQGDLESLRRIKEQAGADFDLILDDGSHDPIHQILSAKVLVPLLRTGGVYIIEDVFDPQLVIPYLPYTCEIKEFDAVRDPWSKLVVIHAV